MVEYEQEAHRLLSQIQPGSEIAAFFTPGNPTDQWLPNQVHLVESDPISLGAWIGANTAFNRIYNAYFRTLEEEGRAVTPHELITVIEESRQYWQKYPHNAGHIGFHTRHVLGESQAYTLGMEEAEEYGPHMEQMRRLNELLEAALPLDSQPDPGPSLSGTT